MNAPVVLLWRGCSDQPRRPCRPDGKAESGNGLFAGVAIQPGRSFNTLKQWRSLATRYDKLALTYCSATALHAVVIWSTLLGDMP